MPQAEREKEEYLERLWEMKELGQSGVADLAAIVPDGFDTAPLERLADEGMVAWDPAGETVELTEKGEGEARRIIRAHRLAERLVFDVFGEDFENGACEFEHIKSPEIVNSICTLLGHPRECPHGRAIPPGECCRNFPGMEKKVVRPLTELHIGQSARVAYIDCRDDRRMHQLNGLQVRPGASIRLHQRSPVYVVECEGATIALDDDIVAGIRVWKDPVPMGKGGNGPVTVKRKRKRWWRLFRPEK